MIFFAFPLHHTFSLLFYLPSKKEPSWANPLQDDGSWFPFSHHIWHLLCGKHAPSPVPGSRAAASWPWPLPVCSLGVLVSWYVPVGTLAVHVWKCSYNDSVHPENPLPVPSPFQPLPGPSDLPPFRNQRVSTLQSWALQELTPAAWLSSVLICQ